MPVLSAAEGPDAGQPTPQSQPDPARPRAKHGGARPGAGAPRGNLNGLKHGLRSKQFAAIGKLMAESPEVRYMLLKLGEREGNKHRNAELIAAGLFARLIEYAKDVAGGKGGLAAITQTPEWRAIKEATAGIDTPEGILPPKNTKSRRRQPRTKRGPKNSTKNQIQKSVD